MPLHTLSDSERENDLLLGLLKQTYERLAAWN